MVDYFPALVLEGKEPDEIITGLGESYCEREGGYILMQYTGLKDKNGTDIYEGDIVRRYGGGILGNPGKVIASGQVIYNAPTFCIEGRVNIFNQDELEVIGDVYRNPELLKSVD